MANHISVVWRLPMWSYVPKIDGIAREYKEECVDMWYREVSSFLLDVERTKLAR